MNSKTNLLKNYVNFVNTTTRQNTYYKIFFFFLLLLHPCFFLLFEYIIEQQLFLEQISKTGSLDSNLISSQYKPDLMARFMEVKAMNARTTQKEIVKEIRYSISCLQR